MARRRDDGALHIMRPCIPGIWPALARANKYSKARNREASRAPFPALWRAISKSHSQFLSGAGVSGRARARSLICAQQASLFAPQRGLSRINSRRQESRTIGHGHGGHDAAYLVRSHLACNNEIAASKRASKRDDRARRIPVFTVNRVRNNNICKGAAVCIRYRRFPSSQTSLCSLQLVENNECVFGLLKFYQIWEI